MNRIILSCLIALTAFSLTAQSGFFQEITFSRADSLRGGLRPERTHYDVHFYDLHVRIDPAAQAIQGYVDMHYQATAPLGRLQVDLYRNMQFDSVVMIGTKALLDFEREADAIFIDLPAEQPAGTGAVLRMYYHGKPTVANMPPWDGGFVWATDERDRPWVGVACEGDGASLWWPNKDHLSDEPDSLRISVAVPPELTCIANGDLLGTSVDPDGFRRFDWGVTYSINNYNVSVNIGHYAHFDDTYTAADGAPLRLDYYVLDYNLERAKEHFRQVQDVLAAFEFHFGKYPFWRDGFALVETPYLGMEHQSAVAYGNQYMRGYLGTMIPPHMDWDYIIVHETGHEYFGNSVSMGDIAEMWIHESFTTYMESLFVEYHYGYDEALGYLWGQRFGIKNQQPMVGPIGVNFEQGGDADYYNKGAWVLNTLRHALADTSQWRGILKGFYEQQAYQITTTQDFIDYMESQTGRDWRPELQQYLYYPSVPTLRYRTEPQADGVLLSYRWQADVPGFALPIRIGDTRLVPVTDRWQSIRLPAFGQAELEGLLQRYLIDVAVAPDR